MEKRVIFRDRQELQAADLGNIQENADRSFKSIISCAITGERMLTGLAVSKKSATEIEIAPGKLWDGTTGKVYCLDESQVISVFSHLPIADTKWLALSVIGQEQDLDIQPRDFLIDLQTGQTQPDAVAMETRRVAVVNITGGIESSAPQKPAAPTGYSLCAYILLGTGGILEIQTAESLQLPQLNRVNGRLKSVEGWMSSANPKIATLSTDVAGLAERISGVLGREEIRELAADVASIKERLNLPDTFSSYAADYFLDADESDVDNADFYARIDEGIRFPWAGQTSGSMSLFNPFETAVKSHDGFVLPAYDDVVRMATTGYAGDISLAQYQFQQNVTKRGAVTRQRVRFGPTRTVCTNSAIWRTGSYDPVTKILKYGNETFLVDDTSHSMIRLTQIWIDTIEEPYWYVSAETVTLGGSQIAQTFLNSQNGWLTGLGLYFTKKAADGMVYINICETDRGMPDPMRTIGWAELDASGLKSYPSETVFNFVKPVYLQAGKRYAITITTSGDHKVAIVSGSEYTQGVLFNSMDGQYYQGDFTKDLMMSFHYAKFRNPRTVVELAPVSLSNGIADLDIISELIVPPSTEYHLEYQVNGVWRPVADGTADTLRGLPAMLPLRAVFVGGPDLMPGIGLAGSRLSASRPATTFKHFSEMRTLPSASSNIEVQLLLEGWETARHTCSIKLKLEDGTIVAPAQVTDKIEPSGIRRIAKFTPATAITKYQIVTDGTSNSALDIFHVAHRIDIAG